MERKYEKDFQDDNDILFVSLLREVKERLFDTGFATFNVEDLQIQSQNLSDLNTLVAFSETLPADRFGLGGRFRCYAEGVWCKEKNGFLWKRGRRQQGRVEEIDYQQGIAYQPEFGAVTRSFMRIPDKILEIGLMKKLILCDLWLTCLADKYESLVCGVHIIRMLSNLQSSAKVTPNCFHQDGQPFTAVHLIERRNSEGGITHIASPRYAGRMLAEVPQDHIVRFQLEKPLDSYIIDDEAISHYVNEVTCAPCVKEAVRTVVLVDFTPAEMFEEIKK